MLRKFVVIVALLAVLSAVPLAQSATAADLGKGAQVFSANCAACHAGGVNRVNPTKTLKKDALAKFNMASIEQIKSQVTHGKAAMPAFKGRLKPEDIENVSAYILDQAEKGWP